MSPFAISFLTILAPCLVVEGAVPEIQEQLSNEDCIKLTDERIDEIKQIIQELTNFIDELANKHDYFNINLLKLDLDKNSDAKDDKPTTLELRVNDCGERSNNCNFSGEYVAKNPESKNNSTNNEAVKDDNQPMTNLSDKPDDSIKTNEETVLKNGIPDRRSQKTTLNVIHKQKTIENKIVKEKTADQITSNNENDQTIQNTENNTIIKQETESVLEESSANNNSTTNDSSNKIKEIKPSDPIGSNGKNDQITNISDKDKENNENTGINNENQAVNRENNDANAKKLPEYKDDKVYAEKIPFTANKEKEFTEKMIEKYENKEDNLNEKIDSKKSEIVQFNQEKRNPKPPHNNKYEVDNMNSDYDYTKFDNSDDYGIKNLNLAIINIPEEVLQVRNKLNRKRDVANNPMFVYVYENCGSKFFVL